jgi:hypothetical protein
MKVPFPPYPANNKFDQ